MKFKYKVLLINIIFLSLSLGFIGFFMIRKNFKLVRESEIKNAVLENNLIQSSVEYSILDIINSKNYDLNYEISELGNRVSNGLISEKSAFFIRYDNEYLYSSDKSENNIPSSLYNDLNLGNKSYVITHASENIIYIYVTSISFVEEKELCVITRSNISEAYSLMNKQINYYRILLLIVLCLCSSCMYLAAKILTKPMEQLNQITDSFAAGDYNKRLDIHTNDEIGLLADKFNNMALSVSEHVEELNDLIKRRDQFVADFTHEIKTPMTTIIGYADTMRSIDLSREDEIISLNYIFSEGKRLEKMSNKLFELIYLKNHKLSFSLIPCEAIGYEVINSISPSLSDKNINLKSSFEPCKILCDKELIKTVFINIIDNARKASSEFSEIVFSGQLIKNDDSTSDFDFYVFKVIDNGCGMNEADINKICDEFYMIDKSRSRKEGGAGLGMSLSSLILEKHYAKLEIESKLGQGTTMLVTFHCEKKSNETEV